MDRILLWIDEHINHPIMLSPLWNPDSKVAFWIWEHTFYAFCVWAVTYYDEYNGDTDEPI